MIIDIYNQFKADQTYKKLMGSDYMIMEYKCPIETEKFQLFTEFNVITYIITGKKDWIASNKIYSVKEGEALFLKKGVYTTRQYFDADHCVLTFFVNDDFIRNFIRENNFSNNRGNDTVTNEQIFEIGVDDTLRTLFYSVYNYLKTDHEIPRELVELKFKELLFAISLNPKNKNLFEFFLSLGNSGNSALESVMMKNFNHDLQLEEFARLSGRSLSSFKRDFKSYYNLTPGRWLINMRLEYAKNLLITSDLNINEICFESGFRNSSHFNKVFKEKYKIPPKKFRGSIQSHS